MPVYSQSRSQDAATLRIEGPLRAPVDRELRSRVLRLLHSGERSIVLDLAGVSRIDAAGVGELARVYSMTIAVNGALRVVHATAWVRGILERVGLFSLLTQSANRPASAGRLSDPLQRSVPDEMGDADDDTPSGSVLRSLAEPLFPAGGMDSRLLDPASARACIPNGRRCSIVC
jgi:anti-anti-sigma factor